ncbi:MAG: VWA domain-containing protein [Pseudomonadota bacterium]|nr:VWA domain-containing protein [Pseudomonadota bacterium]
MRRSRRNVGLSLAFLDVMSCGFGAVVLVFLIMNHESQQSQEVINKDLLAEMRMLDYQVLQGEKDLFELSENQQTLRTKLANSANTLTTLETQLQQQSKTLSELQKRTLAEQEDMAALQSDLDSREDEIERLQALKAATDGNQIRAIKGEGDRQYLTGLKVGGRNIVIIVDTSASMLDETIVNILRRRNMSEEKKRQAPKWQRTLRTVEWLAAQLPLDAEFQLYGFNESVQSYVTDDNLDWQPMSDGSALNAGVDRLSQAVPSGGTNLESLMLAVRDLSPIPDNIYLITDGLPTRAAASPRNPTVDGRTRLKLFREAATRLPRQIPVNVILFPMEGDPMASAAWWQLARLSGGAFISPSWDWP